MSTCHSCGKQNSPQAKLCGHCGAPAAGGLTVKNPWLGAAGLLLVAGLGWGGYALWNARTPPARAQKAIEESPKLLHTTGKAAPAMKKAKELAEARQLNAYAETEAKVQAEMEALAKGQAGHEAARAKLRKAAPENMAAIPAGEFLMGAPKGDLEGRDEHPLHKVYLSAYNIDKHEVTVAQYKEFAKATGRQMREWSTDRHPVYNVDWDDADAYCKWAGGRLPTEAEWEKAARGGTNTKYGFGDDESMLGEYAWYEDNSNGQAHPVGQKKPNQYGLYDMYGNVGEWVSDWYGEDYYKSSTGKNPKGPDSGSRHGIRGSGWDASPNLLRAAYRGGMPPPPSEQASGMRAPRPYERCECKGFRCVIPSQDLK